MTRKAEMSIQVPGYGRIVLSLGFVLFENVRNIDKRLLFEFLLPRVALLEMRGGAVELLVVGAAELGLLLSKSELEPAMSASSRALWTCSMPLCTSDIEASLAAVVLNVSVGRMFCSYSSFIFEISASVTRRSFSNRTSLPRL
jgi:hypothetical protein